MPMKLPLAAAALLAAAGFGTGVYYLWPKGHAVSSCRLHAPVPAAAQKALAAIAGRIEYTVERTRGRVFDRTWDDPLKARQRDVAYGERGVPTSETIMIHRTHSTRIVSVDFGNRTWTSSAGRSAVPIGERPALAAQANRDAVYHGTDKILGRQLVDGRETLHLHRVEHVPSQTLPTPKAFRLPKGVSLPRIPAMTYIYDIWVDPLTYLTVRSTTHFSPRRFALTNDIAWLPRTRANLAKTSVSVPPGFTRQHVSNGVGTVFVLNRRVASTRCR